MKKILWDIDGTLLNFDLAETIAINNCFDIFDLEKPTEEMIRAYKKINTNYWERLERNEVTRDEELLGRLGIFLIYMELIAKMLSILITTTKWNLEKLMFLIPMARKL